MNETETHVDDGELRTAIGEYLGAHRVMTLATADPWAAAVFYVHDGFALCFVSSPRSRHCTTLARNPRVAVTIQEDYADWHEIKGIQAEGTAETVPSADEARVRGLYAAKFQLAGALEDPLVRALARVRWYRVVPDRIWFLDNGRGFGHRDCLDLRGDGRAPPRVRT